ncbi:MAG TPA: CPXCG motif-containing cysteine-rich protein [Steroidobacteraceae bacterium]|nr:CPXCG motif-containing cysteine-rich protein [Steroidobacteraceae bacterium]
MLSSAEVVCPYCWQTIELTIDPSVDQQSYIEDCPVCCHPMQVLCLAESGELVEIRVEAAS